MCARVIGAIGGPSTCPDADAVQPGLNVGAFPDAAAGLFSSLLGGPVLARRILRRVERKAHLHQPFADVRVVNLTGGYRAPVAVQANRGAVHWPPGNECIERVRSRGTAPVGQAVLPAAELAALWRIDTPQPNARAVDLDRIAVDYASLADEIVGRRTPIDTLSPIRGRAACGQAPPAPWRSRTPSRGRLTYS